MPHTSHPAHHGIILRHNPSIAGDCGLSPAYSSLSYSSHPQTVHAIHSFEDSVCLIATLSVDQELIANLWSRLAHNHIRSPGIVRIWEHISLGLDMTPQFTFTVSHLDPECGPWSSLEYRTIAQECGDAGSRFVVCSVPESMDLSALSTDELVNKVEVTTKSEEELFESEYKAGRVCLLDPKAEQDLGPSDGQRFSVFLFGGILGDDPPRDRTVELRKKGYPARRLGPIQMTTDTAVRITRLVLQEQRCLDQLPYVDFPELKIDEHESTEMPFRYLANEDGKPIMPDGMLELIKKDADNAFEDFE